MYRINATSTFSSIAIAAAIVTSSCSPNVVTNIVKEYPNQVDPAQVHVYNIGDTVPEEAVYIGNVLVTAGKSNASNCQYDKVLEKAVNSTAKSGGNLLALTAHKENVGFNLCHEVSGDIMWVNDTSRLVGSPYLSISENYKSASIMPLLPKNTFYINIGYGHISSDLYLNSSTKAPKSAHNGLDFQIGYDYMFNKHIGIGAVYSGFKGSVNADGASSDYMINFVGPYLVLKQRPNNGAFIFEERFGVGWYNYYEWVDKYHTTTDGFGSIVQLGVEYLLSERCGLAFSFGTVSGSLPNEGYGLPDGQKSGIGRMFVNLGCRFHF